MQRRIVAGAAATLSVVVAAAAGDFATDADLVGFLLAAGLVGGLVAGVLSGEPGHVGAGARASSYGGAVAFVGFVAIGAVQSILEGDLSALFVGFQTLLIAAVVVPLYALSGAVAAAVGVRLRRLLADRVGR